MNADTITKIGTQVTDGAFIYTLNADPFNTESPWQAEDGQWYTLDGAEVSVLD